MQQKEISRWLKAITIVLALMGAVFFLYIMPVLAMSWRDADESLAYLFMPGLLYGWCIAVICYAILYQFWKVCVQIGKDNSFSKETVRIRMYNSEGGWVAIVRSWKIILTYMPSWYL